MTEVIPFPEKTKFYYLGQNNSGGSFDLDIEKGLTHHVLIQAKNADQASALAQDAGIYFDGVCKGIDCGCCGDRWYEPDEFDAYDEPQVYGQPVDDYWNMTQWMKDGREICVHYLDGRKEWYGVKPSEWCSETKTEIRTDNGKPVYEEDE